MENVSKFIDTVYRKRIVDHVLNKGFISVGKESHKEHGLYDFERIRKDEKGEVSDQYRIKIEFLVLENFLITIDKISIDGGIRLITKFVCGTSGDIDFIFSRLFFIRLDDSLCMNCC